MHKQKEGTDSIVHINEQIAAANLLTLKEHKMICRLGPPSIARQISTTLDGISEQCHKWLRNVDAGANDGSNCYIARQANGRKIEHQQSFYCRFGNLQLDLCIEVT